MRAMILAAAAPLAAFAFRLARRSAGLDRPASLHGGGAGRRGRFRRPPSRRRRPRHHAGTGAPGTFVVVAPGAFGWPAPEGWALYNNRS